MSAPETTAISKPSDRTYAGLMYMANRRREVLVDGGCSTYIIGVKPGQPNITCLCCGKTSYNENDVANVYCGFCHQFHAEWK